MLKVRATQSDTHGIVVVSHGGTINVRNVGRSDNATFLYPTAHANVIDTVRSMNIFGTMSGISGAIARDGISGDWKRVGNDIKAASAFILKGRDGERKRA